MPRGRPQASKLGQGASYLKDTGMAGLASAWAMARRRPKEYCRKVDVASRFSGVCPHISPDCRKHIFPLYFMYEREVCAEILPSNFVGASKESLSVIGFHLLGTWS